MATRMAKRGASAIIVHAWNRDLGEMRKLGMPVWADATSVVSVGAEPGAWAVEVNVEDREVYLCPQ